jgi:hypothetical protein
MSLLSPPSLFPDKTKFHGSLVGLKIKFKVPTHIKLKLNKL